MNTKRCVHYHWDCANAVGANCRLLSSQIDKPECPFYKTDETMKKDREKAHQHLLDIGRYDLIEKYEYNKARNW